MDGIFAILGMAVVAFLPLLLVYWFTRKLPPNVGRQHGGGLDGISPAYGILPFEESKSGTEISKEAESRALERENARWRPLARLILVGMLFVLAMTIATIILDGVWRQFR